MTVTNQYERDFENFQNQVRPGRFDPRLLQNIINAGDGYPGLQKAIRNWVEANFPDLLDFTTHTGNVNAHIDNITDITTRNHNDLQNIGANDHISNLNQITTRNHSDLQSIGTSDHHVKYTDSEARGAINNIFGSDGKADADIDLDGNEIDNVSILNEKIYYVTTDAELDAAISDIESNNYIGYIHVLSNLTDVQITLNDASAGYTIDGHGHTIDSDGDNIVITVTNAYYCLIKDIRIDASAITTVTKSPISITEASNNKVLLDNVYVYMPEKAGIGIDINSNYVEVINCTVDRGEQGINNSGYYCKIIGNTIKNQTGYSILDYDGNDSYGINNSGNYCIIENNNINTVTGGAGTLSTGYGHSSTNGGVGYGINNTGNNCTIGKNVLNTITGGLGARGEYDVDDGFDGGDVYALNNTGTNCSIGENTIDTVTGGNGGNGSISGTGSGGNGGNSYAINNTGTHCIIGKNTIDTVTGGNGGNATVDVNDEVGGNGGSSYCINNTGTNCTIGINTIYNITGGDGGTGCSYTTGGDGGVGGDSYGLLNSGVYCSIIGNTKDTIVGGDGGDGGGSAGDGGAGGNSYGIAMNNNTDCTINGNTVEDVTASSGGSGTPAGAAGTPIGLDDLGTADYNIWTSNAARGLGEGINDGANSINANNLT